MPIDFEGRLERFASEVYMELRAAQDHVLKEFGQSHVDTPDLAIELPIGVGKTLIALLIADWALDEGRSVAYLSGTRQLAEQVEQQAQQLGDLAIHRFWAGHYPGASLDDYHQGQAIGVMNYWVYFNSRPVVQPADVVIFDDAHIAEQPLASLFSLRIARRDQAQLYQSICDLVLAHTNAYSTLRAMRDGDAPPSTPPELLAFNDWSAIVDAAESLLRESEFIEGEEARYVWPTVQGKIVRSGVLISPSGIEIRPYNVPTQTIPGYSQARQRLYLSATLGTMDDLQRRLGVKPIVKIEVPEELRTAQTGSRLFLVNPGTEASFEEPMNFAFQQSMAVQKVAWLCASHADADEVVRYLQSSSAATFQLRPGDETALEAWLEAPRGHLVTAGRFDGLDFPGDACRLVVLPKVPAATTEFERFVVAYLGDATFMRHRVGQRVTQALGRANRDEDDWALYLGLDPAFGSVLADPSVSRTLGDEVRSSIRIALELHGRGWQPVQQAAQRFWDDRSLPDLTQPRRRGRTQSEGDSSTANHEVAAITALWLGDFVEAAEQARQAATLLASRNEPEHGAFWRYVEAHANWLGGRPQDLHAAQEALSDALRDGPRTAWFVRLRRTLDEIQQRAADTGQQDGLFLAWEEWIRERGARALEEVNRARLGLHGTHNQRVESIEVLGRLCGVVTDRSSEQSAWDCRWRWVGQRRTEIRVWEIKTREASARLPRRDINQLLGQITVQSQRAQRARTYGCLVTDQTQAEQDAQEAARDKICIMNTGTIARLFDLMADLFSRYVSTRGSGTAQERGTARELIESRLPPTGWIERLFAPSQGAIRLPSEIDAMVSRT